MSFLDIFTISPLQRPREISQNVSGPYYVRRGAGYKINICAKLYYLGRAKVFSSVATDFGSWTIICQRVKRPYFCHITLTYLCKIMLCNMLSEAAFLKKKKTVIFSLFLPCRIICAKPDLETWPYHLSFHFLIRVRSSPYSPMAA